MNAYFSIIRPNVCFLAVFGVLVGVILSFARSPAIILIALLAAFLICAGGNVINDYYDYEIDKINKPKRPLPSGKIAPKKAAAYYLVLSATGVALALLVSPAFFWIAVFNFTISTLYAWKLKKIAIIGNIADSFLAAVTFLSGALIGMGFLDLLNSPVLILAGVAFLTTMGREIYKDIEDIKGDESLGARTLPIIVGGAVSMTFARILVFSGAISATVPYVYHVFGISYIISVIPCITVLLYSIMLKDPKKAQKTVKVGMFLGIFAFLVGVLIG